MRLQFNKIQQVWILVCLSLSLSSVCSADNSVPTLLGIPFGEVCTIKAKFVDKPNTYYAQNISHAEYFLKIFEINRTQLSEPLIVEPVYKNMKIEKGKEYTFKAYEIICSGGEPKGWGDIPSQINYSIKNKVVIKSL